ncbi:MAG: hypothetical protein LBV74_16665, partial [Tannerella sp.]|nr:hypothetical protein [Tannerella sp.]
MSMKSSALTFRTAIQQINGLSFIYENLPLHSPLGRKKLMELPYSTDRNAIELELQLTSQWVDMLRDESKNEQMEKLSGNLSSFHDISHTLSNLAAGKVMDDIQLFEVKKFAILTENILNILNVETLCATSPETVLSSFNIHSLCDVIALLDPEQNRIPYFYIYAQYSDELAEKRVLYLQEKEVNKKEALFIEMSQLEDQIREELSVKLSPFSSILLENAQHIATLDLSLAKAKLSLHLGL